MGLSLVRAEEEGKRAEQNALRKLFCAALTTMSVVKQEEQEERASIMSCGAASACFLALPEEGKDKTFCIFS